MLNKVDSILAFSAIASFMTGRLAQLFPGQILNLPTAEVDPLVFFGQVFSIILAMRIIYRHGLLNDVPVLQGLPVVGVFAPLLPVALPQPNRGCAIM
ncbi:MAG: hypothetical protein NTV32_04935 [Gammaproteobacteria bacterium]|jgi:hypothetical protein|nr:hypothetical protein [Gammaproteobacteria bacterium]